MYVAEEYPGTGPFDEEERRRRQGDPQQPQQPQQPQTAATTANPFDSSRVPGGVPAGWAEDFIRRNPGDYHRLDSAYASELQPKGGGNETPTQQWANNTPNHGTEIFNWMKSQAEKAEAERVAQQAKADDLYGRYSDRATQGLAIDRNDPTIRAQADAYSANEQRSARSYLADAAEKAGPYANLRGEQRLSAERVGQRTGTFEAELMARELTSRREEIAQALAGMGGMLSGEQARALQNKLGMFDNLIRQQGVNLQGQSLDQDWQRALMQNDQFLRGLGLEAWDRENYWDSVHRGLN